MLDGDNAPQSVLVEFQTYESSLACSDVLVIFFLLLLAEIIP